VPDRWQAVHVDELDSIPVAGVVWHPVRRRLGIQAFGMNAYTAEAVGENVIEEHDETGSGAGGHEEVYFVARGRATFTLDGEEVEAPAGTFVFIRDPAVKRVAVAETEDALVIAVGNEPGKAYEVSPWEAVFAVAPLLDAGRFDEAIDVLAAELEQKPGNPSLLYNIACAEARAGRAADAIAHLGAAIAARPAFLERAREDPDFDSIRDDPGFPG
jgi:tetratricopeptide (TPR) repeat protein